MWLCLFATSTIALGVKMLIRCHSTDRTPKPKTLLPATSLSLALVLRFIFTTHVVTACGLFHSLSVSTLTVFISVELELDAARISGLPLSRVCLCSCRDELSGWCFLCAVRFRTCGVLFSHFAPTRVLFLFSFSVSSLSPVHHFFSVAHR